MNTRIAMHRRRAGLILRSASWIVLGAACGCGPSAPATLSPTSEQDPERHRQAVRAVEEKARSDQEAERKAFQRLRRSAPGT